MLSNIGLPVNRSPECFAVSDSALYVSIFLEGTYISYDQGNSWSFTGFDSFYNYVSVANTLYLTTDNGVYGTKDDGQSWHALNYGFKSLKSKHIAAKSDTLFVGIENSGIWKQLAPGNALGTDLLLDSKTFIVYPNPASTQIHIETDQGALGIVQLYDLQGNEIMRSKCNEQSTMLDVTYLPRGVYIVKYGDMFMKVVLHE